jgi:hypothetical protein
LGSNPLHGATSIARYTLRAVLALLPLAAGLALLRLLPTTALAVDQPAVGPWRFDPLALIGCSIVPLAAVRPRPLMKGLRTALAVAGLMVALLVTDPAPQMLSLVLVSLLVVDGLGPRWFVALAIWAFVMLGTTLPGVSAGIVLHAAILMAFIGSGGLPPIGQRDVSSEIVLRPFWLFVMLRTLMFEPWPVPTVVAATTLGTLALAVIAHKLLRTTPAVEHERSLAALLMMAFVAVSQNTILGVVAALWALAMYAVLAVATTPKTFAPFTTVCITFGVAGWWTAGALAAAGGFLGALVVCLTSVAVCIAVLLQSVGIELPRLLMASRSRVMLLTVVLVLATPWATTTLALPVAQHLGAGLTAPGLLDVWPFIGVSALDAGHRRVTLAPSIVLGCLFVFVCGAVWLASRIRGHVDPTPVAPATLDDVVQRIIRARVWWLR